MTFKWIISFGDNAALWLELFRVEAEQQRRLIAMLPIYYPGISGCRNVAEFECLNRIEEGTFGVVYRAKEKKTGQKYIKYYIFVNVRSQGKIMRYVHGNLIVIDLLLACWTSIVFPISVQQPFFEKDGSTLERYLAVDCCYERRLIL